MVYEKRVNALIEVIKTQPDVLTATDWTELEEIAQQLPEDSEEIWKTISPWLNSHPEIEAAHETKFKNTPSVDELAQHLGPGGSQPEKPTPTNNPTLREKLLNEISTNNPNHPKNNPPFVVRRLG